MPPMRPRLKYLLGGLGVTGLSVALVWQTAATEGVFGFNPLLPVFGTALIAAGLLASAILYLPEPAARSGLRLVGGLVLTVVLFAALAFMDVCLYFAFGGDLRT